MSPLLGTHGSAHLGRSGVVVYITAGSNGDALVYYARDDKPGLMSCRLVEWTPTNPVEPARFVPARNHLAEAREIGQSIVNTALGNYGVRELVEVLGNAIGRAAKAGRS